MTNDTAAVRCDCGYECEGATIDERIVDGQRHARDVHGIEVSAEQVRRQGGWTW